jgi:hypothetical protein
MAKRTAGLASTFLLALAVAAFTGSALAGNGNGNSNEQTAGSTPALSATVSASQDHGNSANAPGQIKKQSTTSTASAQSSGGAGGSASQNSASTKGVKPTSATSHDTNCSLTSSGCASTGANATTMGAGDASKRYGNGTTAAQVARQNGATSGNVHGPGNSQPHKMAPCPGGHEVDVHALKAKKNKGCASSSSPTNNSNNASTTSNTNVTVTGNVTATTATSPSATAAAGTTAQQGGVLGATAAAGHGNAAPQGGVLGALASGALPFTGFPLWVVVAAALGVIALGLMLRRQTRVPA